jgi:hypothetical protein
MKNLKTLLEASLLADIEDTIETGNKYENLTLTELYNSKTQLEFETKFNVFRSLFESNRKGTEIRVIKPRNCYIAFVENISMKSNDPDLCRDSIYIGTDKDLYRLTWINGPQSKTIISKTATLTLDYFTERQRHLNTSIYVCPKKIKDESNKLIIYNLE